MTFTPPSVLVERAEWTEILRERREGMAWDRLRSRTGVTALGRAVIDGRADIVERLLNLEAPVKPSQLFDGQIFSPLWAAIQRHDSECLELLLSAGANPDEKDGGNGNTPLQETTELGWSKGTQMLIQAGADISHKADPMNDTPLMHQWMDKLEDNPESDELVIEVISSFLKAGANPYVVKSKNQPISLIKRVYEYECQANIASKKEAWQKLKVEAEKSARKNQSLHLSQLLKNSTTEVPRDRRL